MRAPAFAPPCTAARRTAPDVRLAYLRQGRPDAHLAKALAEAGRRVEAVAIEDLVHQRFDAIIVDHLSPTLSLVREAAANAAGAVLIVFTGAEPCAPLLRAGADACLRRPVSVLELLARLDTLARRGQAEPGGPGGLRLDAAARSAVQDGRTVSLSRREFDVLDVIVRRPGRVLSPAEIVELAWGEAAEIDPARVSAHVSRLRAKLSRLPGAPAIRAVRGHGYVFETGA